MHPILFSIGPVTVHSYGFMLAVGFLTAISLASKRAHIFNLSKDAANNLALLLIFSGVIGSRALYVVLNREYFFQHPLESFMIQRGGLVFYGGFIIAFVSGLLYALANRISILDTADFLMPFVALAHSIGRIGCFLNGCCYGTPTSSILGVYFPGSYTKVYPTQIFSSAGLFIIFLALFHLQKRRSFKGQVLASYLTLYGIFRFLIEFLRGDLLPVFYGLTVTQIISIAVLISGVCIYLIKRPQKA